MWPEEIAGVFDVMMDIYHGRRVKTDYGLYIICGDEYTFECIDDYYKRWRDYASKQNLHEFLDLQLEKETL